MRIETPACPWVKCALGLPTAQLAHDLTNHRFEIDFPFHLSRLQEMPSHHSPCDLEVCPGVSFCRRYLGFPCRYFPPLLRPPLLRFPCPHLFPLIALFVSVFCLGLSGRVCGTFVTGGPSRHG